MAEHLPSKHESKPQYLKKREFTEHLLCSCYSRDTELNQKEKFPAFMGLTLIGEAMQIQEYL
jgi:hypothetical protein